MPSSIDVDLLGAAPAAAIGVVVAIGSIGHWAVATFEDIVVESLGTLADRFGVDVSTGDGDGDGGIGVTMVAKAMKWLSLRGGSPPGIH